MVAKRLLRLHHPDLFAQIRPSQDQEIDLESLGSSSREKIWWQRNCGHDWKSEVVSRVSGKGCPICAGKSVLKGETGFETLHADLASEWHPIKNGSLTPSEFRPKSAAVVWWLGACGHEYQAKIGERVRGRLERPHTTGCPVCLNRKVVLGTNDLATRRPDLISELHPTLNGDLDPLNDHLESKSNYFWICPNGHEFEQRLAHRINQNQGCPYCANKRVKQGFNDMVTLNPAFLRQWDYSKNVKLTPDSLTPGTNKEIWWLCKYGHSWKARGAKRSAGQECPTCMNRDLKSGFNDLETKAPEIAKTWDFERNGELTPSMVLAGTHEKFWWRCEQGHAWETSPATRVRTNCPRCSKAGFDQTRPGHFYFIEHKNMGARKVGIANLGSDRVKTWIARGWELIYIFESESGLQVLNLETEVLRWIRKELDMPSFLGQEEMGRFGGGSETFSGEGISNQEIVQKTKVLLRTMAEQHT